ncbi:MAG: hypothetical protein M9963_05695 [Kiritimatiellae bacterium]|nr:hypothetical protein [Kiritimatiellia bacterium]
MNEALARAEARAEKLSDATSSSRAEREALEAQHREAVNALNAQLEAERRHRLQAENDQKRLQSRVDELSGPASAVQEKLAKAESEKSDRLRELEALRAEREQLNRELVDVRQRLNVVLSSSAEQKKELDRLIVDHQALSKALAETRKQAERAVAESADLRASAAAVSGDESAQRAQELERAVRAAEDGRAEAQRQLAALTKEYDLLKKRYDVFATALKHRRS